jgi:cytochrome c
MNRKPSALFLAVSLFLASCGHSGDNNSGSNDSAASTAAQPAPGDTGASAAANASDAMTPAAQKALEMIAASDCTTCHRLHQATSGSSIGPAYDQVAAKYSPAADSTVDRLVKKIIAGGYGVWGTIPMTSHPALQSADVRTMVEYILSLKK